MSWWSGPSRTWRYKNAAFRFTVEIPRGWKVWNEYALPKGAATPHTVSVTFRHDGDYSKLSILGVRGGIAIADGRWKLGEMSDRDRFLATVASDLQQRRIENSEYPKVERCAFERVRDDLTVISVVRSYMGRPTRWKLVPDATIEDWMTAVIGDTSYAFCLKGEPERVVKLTSWSLLAAAVKSLQTATT